MALRDQPYIPLYVQDFETDEKLIYCSALATGVYIRIMCHMHKSEQYGKILLKQNFKQTSKQVKNFALQLAKILPYDLDIIEQGLSELISENVLIMDGDILMQKRMVRDNEISELRANSGRKGGRKTQHNFASKFAKAKKQANYENENEYEYEEIEKNKKEKEIFEEFRKIYPGKKRGLDTEFENFIKKHKDWRQVVPLLKHAAEIEISEREDAERRKTFYPVPANLQTWINQRRWEQFETESIPTPPESKWQTV